MKISVIVLFAFMMSACGSSFEVWTGERSCAGEEQDLEMYLTNTTDDIMGFEVDNEFIYFLMEDYEEKGDEVTFEVADTEFELKREGNELTGEQEIDQGDGTTIECDVELERQN